jgi:hypothetical protein
LGQRRQQQSAQHEAGLFGIDERCLIYHGVRVIRTA